MNSNGQADIGYWQMIEMQKDPVAWMLVDEINGDYMLERHPSGDYDWIPLYTHPVKELTDEEILDFIGAFCLDMGDYWDLHEKNAIPMIRAILRKASEK